MIVCGVCVCVCVSVAILFATVLVLFADKWPVISWKAIESLYLSETSTNCPGVRLCPKLTRDHVLLNSYTRMCVNLAAQVTVVQCLCIHL